MKFIALPLIAAFASTSIAATPPPSSTTTTPAAQARDSVNGSMTDAKLTGDLDQDTSQLKNDTTSGTTSGAIIDRTEKRKKKSKKKHSAPTQQTSETTTSESGTTSSRGYGNEDVYDATTTQGRSRNDEMNQNTDSARPSDEAGSREK